MTHGPPAAVLAAPPGRCLHRVSAGFLEPLRVPGDPAAVTHSPACVSAAPALRYV